MKLLPTLMTAVSLLLSSVTTASDGIMIYEKSAWARATPPGSTTTAIYLMLMNHSEKDINFTAVSSDISDRLELHTHINQDGLMKMQQVSSITVPASDHAELKPHGDHIMVFNLKEQLKEGAEISVELTFDNGSTQSINVSVLKESPKLDHSTMQHGKNYDSEMHHGDKKHKDTETHDQHNPE